MTIKDMDPVLLGGLSHVRHTIAISGAAATGHCSPTAFENTVKIGTEMGKRGIVLLTGATTGVPYWAAKAVKEAGGFVIGLSPASSRIHHIKTYRLPVEYHDLLIYTGFDYAGRDLLLSRAADAVITICGRTGTLHEFTTAFEDGTPQGVLLGSGGTAELIPEILEKSHRSNSKVVFESDPIVLLDKIIALIEDGKRNADTLAFSELGIDAPTA